MHAKYNGAGSYFKCKKFSVYSSAAKVCKIKRYQFTRLGNHLITATLKKKSDIEQKMAAAFGRRFCCLTNRGTTGLTAAFAGLDLPKGSSIIFPAAMCSIPVFSASFAGHKPLFADVNLLDGNFDLNHLEKILQQTSDQARAVVPIHMFGKPENLERLQQLCQAFQAYLVEDCALSLGAHWQGKPIGSFGNVSALSFVRKMVPLEMGGAVLTDDPTIYDRVRAFVDALSAPAACGNLDAAMKAFHRLTGFVATTGWTQKNLLGPYARLFRSLLLYRTTDQDWEDSIVLEEMAALPEVVIARRTRAEIYQTVLNHPRIVPLETQESCFFCYPVRLPGIAAEDFLDFAHSQGFSFKRVAYPDISPLFTDSLGLPHAQILEKEVIGLPVDENQPVSSFWEYAEDFLKVFQDYLQTQPSPADISGRLEMRMGT